MDLFSTLAYVVDRQRDTLKGIANAGFIFKKNQ
jgi:hypothetical protein